jgi:hypothetical protein
MDEWLDRDGLYWPSFNMLADGALNINGYFGALKTEDSFLPSRCSSLVTLCRKLRED